MPYSDLQKRRSHDKERSRRRVAERAAMGSVSSLWENPARVRPLCVLCLCRETPSGRPGPCRKTARRRHPERTRSEGSPDGVSTSPGPRRGTPGAGALCQVRRPSSRTGPAPVRALRRAATPTRTRTLRPGPRQGHALWWQGPSIQTLPCPPPEPGNSARPPRSGSLHPLRQVTVGRGPLKLRTVS